MKRSVICYRQAATTEVSSSQEGAASSSPTETAACEDSFRQSELWLFSFVSVKCTGIPAWSISRRISGGRVQCAALDPTDRLAIVIGSDGTKTVMFLNLWHDEWITTADQFGDVRISIDGSELFHKITQVDVSAKPPLRYGFGWQLSDDVEALQHGGGLEFDIGSLISSKKDWNWKITLGGSRTAIDQATQCATHFQQSPQDELSDRKSILEVQARLYNLNYDVGTLDGVVGPKTTADPHRAKARRAAAGWSCYAWASRRVAKGQASDPLGGDSGRKQSRMGTSVILPNPLRCRKRGHQGTSQRPRRLSGHGISRQRLRCHLLVSIAIPVQYAADVGGSTEAAVSKAKSDCNQWAQPSGGSCELKTTVCAQADGD